MCSYLLAKDHVDTAWHCFDGSQTQFAVFSSSLTSTVTLRLYFSLKSHLRNLRWITWQYKDLGSYVYLFRTGWLSFRNVEKKLVNIINTRNYQVYNFQNLFSEGWFMIFPVLCNAEFTLDRKEALLKQLTLAQGPVLSSPPPCAEGLDSALHTVSAVQGNCLGSALSSVNN